MEEMKEFYNELKSRLEFLENKRSEMPEDDLVDDLTTRFTDGRIAELQLVILRVQQILLANIK